MAREVILVTGATGSVGRAIASLLATKKDAVLCLNARREEALRKLSANLGSPSLLPGDLSTPGLAEKLVEEITRAHGALDVVISTVGGIDPDWPRLQQTSDEAFSHMLNLNLMGAFRLARAAALSMQAGGRMVFVTSKSGLSPEAGGGAYAISKAALTAMVSVLAGDLKTAGIRVNAVAPSIIFTEENKRAMPGADYSRWVTPEEIAHAVSFLASEASSGLTGVTVPLYGRL